MFNYILNQTYGWIIRKTVWWRQYDTLGEVLGMFWKKPSIFHIILINTRNKLLPSDRVRWFVSPNMVKWIKPTRVVKNILLRYWWATIPAIGMLKCALNTVMLILCLPGIRTVCSLVWRSRDLNGALCNMYTSSGPGFMKRHPRNYISTGDTDSLVTREE